MSEEVLHRRTRSSWTGTHVAMYRTRISTALNGPRFDYRFVCEDHGQELRTRGAGRSFSPIAARPDRWCQECRVLFEENGRAGFKRPDLECKPGRRVSRRRWAARYRAMCLALGTTPPTPIEFSAIDEGLLPDGWCPPSDCDGDVYQLTSVSFAQTAQRTGATR